MTQKASIHCPSSVPSGNMTSRLRCRQRAHPDGAAAVDQAERPVGYVMLNLVYTGVQILHNFGAVAVVGSPAIALWFARDNSAAQCRLALLLVIGWAAQGASGGRVGMTNYFLQSQHPAIS